ncbi:MAG: hypothetical protein WBX11_18890 [Thiobacillaceae bacterium]
MTERTRILDSLNERTLLLRSLVNTAVAANDRAKYRFTLLQAAQAHAERPDEVISSLGAERLAAKVRSRRLAYMTYQPLMAIWFSSPPPRPFCHGCLIG